MPKLPTPLIVRRSCGAHPQRKAATPPATSPSQAKGFTLVELLIVIGIIALLISILMPALSRARESAITVQCASNLRQLYLGAAMYAEANRGYLPTLRIDTPPNQGYTGSTDVIFQNRFRGLGMIDHPDRMERYLKILACPKDRWVRDKLEAPGPIGNTKGDTSYIWHGGFVAGRDQHVDHGSRVRLKDKPAEAPLAFERGAHWNYIGMQSFHKGRFNALGMDGHVETVNFERINDRFFYYITHSFPYADFTVGRALERVWLNL